MNEANHVTIESVSTDDAIEAIELLWGHAMAYCNEYRPSGVKEVRDAKHTLTRLWLERDALQTRERQLLVMLAWSKGWVPVWWMSPADWHRACGELFGIETSNDSDQMGQYAALVEAALEQGKAIIDAAGRKLAEQ